jgi:hypothetical protein
MKKSLIIIIISAIAVTIVFAQSRDRQSRYFISPQAEKSFRDRLDEIDRKIEALTTRIIMLEEKIEPTPELKKSGEAKPIGDNFKIGQIIYFRNNDSITVLQIIDKSNMIVKLNISYVAYQSPSPDGTFMLDVLNDYKRTVWLCGVDTSNLVDDSSIKHTEKQLFKISGTKSYDNLFTGIKTLFVLEPVE